MRRVLIIDALNAFLRAYIVDPSLSRHGDPIGGIKGFLKILQRHVRELNPDQIVVAWDGAGGSKRRKAADKNYKSGRTPVRLNRAVRSLTDDEEMRNKVWQQVRLQEYLAQMPIIQLGLEGIEADDVIAYICQMKHYRGCQKIIISNDKDFMQLCDDSTVLYRPTSDEFLNVPRIVETLGIHPTNMALARAIAGDTSDNLKGIAGVGLKTIKKRLPFLAENKTYTIDEVIKHCEEIDSGLKIYSSIAEGKGVVEHNYQMMQLYSPAISVRSKAVVDHQIENYECYFSKTDILKMMVEDGFSELNWEALKQSLTRISVTCFEKKRDK